MPYNLTYTSGNFVCDILAALEQNVCDYVYLRNHEDLPSNIGNDVDILVPEGKKSSAIAFFRQYVEQANWRYVRIVEFGPSSVYFYSKQTNSFFHIDVFDRIDWHFLPYANCPALLQSKVWSGHVYRLNTVDETLLNIMTRVLYSGSIRNKHRLQGNGLVDKYTQKEIEESALSHFGFSAKHPFLAYLMAREWDLIEKSKNRLRITLIINSLISRPRSLYTGIVSYVRRALKRIMDPPGLFIAFIGADGSGKSTIIEKLREPIIEASGRSDLKVFHWKPSRRSFRNSNSGIKSVDPRGSKPRGSFLSLIFLFYHLIGFIVGWLRFIRPACAMNRFVIADRYIYDLRLDPTRLRLKLPSWILAAGVKVVPSPNLVIGLSGDPETISFRKNELTPAEVNHYQDGMILLKKDIPELIILDAMKKPEELIQEIQNIILDYLSTH